MGADTTTVLLGILAIALLIVLVAAIVWRHARRQSRTPDNSVIHAFTQELFAAQTSPAVRTVIARHLPTLLRTRHVWVSGYAGGRRQLIAPLDDGGQVSPLLSGTFQEWTTLPLRAGEHVIGLMGVDAATARDPHIRYVMEAIAPLIGQAMQNAHAVDALREASLMDALTGTATRREGLARLHAELKRAQRTGAAMAVMLLDLDRFKAINDRCGHAMGDAVLTAVGQTLRRTLRASDIRCRWGGEEFLVVLPDTDLARAQVVAQGLLRNIAAATVPTPQGPIGTSTSIGLTMTSRGEVNLEAIIHRADVALYRAKHAGRGCVRYVTPNGDAGEVVALENAAPDPPPSVAADEGAGTEKTLAFPDRRNPDRPDRRSVPSPGRRSTDRGA
jgi:diguanylate cyclase (GGDEF)-like protein